MRAIKRWYGKFEWLPVRERSAGRRSYNDLQRLYVMFDSESRADRLLLRLRMVGRGTLLYCRRSPQYGAGFY